MIVETIKRFLPLLVALLLSIPAGITVAGAQGIDTYEVYGDVLDENGNEIEAHIVFEHSSERIEIDADGSYSTDISGLDIEHGDSVNVTATAYNLYCDMNFIVEEETTEKELNLTLTPQFNDMSEIPPVNEFDEPAFPSSDIPGFPEEDRGELELDDDVYRYLRPESMLQPEKVERISRESAPLPNLKVELDTPGFVVVNSDVKSSLF